MDKFAVVHEDDTVCAHEGEPHMASPGGPALCAGGVRVTHVRGPGGHLVELGEAVHSAYKAAAVFAATLTPLVAAAASFAKSLSNDPRLRALAAAAQVLEDAAVAERPAGPPANQPPRERFDPCGNGRM